VGPIRAGLKSLVRADAFDTDDVASVLQAGGVEVSAVEGSPPGAPVVVFFDEFSPGLFDFIRLSSASGRRRVLAVDVARSKRAPAAQWQLLEVGASDVLVWDDAAAAKVVARVGRWAKVDELVDAELARGELIGQSPAWRSVLRQVVEVAAFTDSSVLLTGESGTGKELMARLIHRLDARPNKPEMVVVDCTTVVPSLSGSEFFGHEKGSFTGAVSSRDGAFAAANGGTLFLDEVGELPPTMQAELLRVVQEGMYKRLGSLVWQRTAFRLVCATNRDLNDEQSEGRFRRDLYYRIAAITVHLPSLEERPEDTLPLFCHFLDQLRPHQSLHEVEPVVRDLLLARRYPGNVRDLRQLAVRVSSRHVGPGPITAGDMPHEERPVLPEADSDGAAVDFHSSVRQALTRGVTLKEIRQAAAEAAIRVAIDDAGGNLRLAARRLGVTDRALQLRRAAGRPPDPGEDELEVGDRSQPVVAAAR
jgi:transcriptional regulator with GAF, ATPase, and Fis domain